MMRNKNIVFIGHEPWGFLRYRRQQIVIKLVENDNRVLYIEPPKAWNSGYGNKYQRNIGIREVSRHLSIYTPINIFPFNRFKIIEKLNFFFINIVIKRFINKSGFCNPIIIGSCNMLFLKYIKYYKKESNLTIYDWADLYSANQYLSPKESRNICKMEKNLSELADIVFVVSHNLYKRSEKINPNTYLLPNGADFNHFYKVNSSERKIAPDMEKIKPPIIGYTGALKPSFDFDLISYMAEKNPNWSIVLIGPPRKDDMILEEIKSMKKYRNILLFGEKPYELLPNYIKKFDVCILPYKKIEYTDYFDPLKLYEYMAAGKPIVSSDYPAARRFESVICISNNYDGFVQEIRKILRQKNHKNRYKQIEMAKNNSWDVRIDEMGSIIEKHRLEKR